MGDRSEYFCRKGMSTAADRCATAADMADRLELAAGADAAVDGPTDAVEILLA